MQDQPPNRGGPDPQAGSPDAAGPAGGPQMHGAWHGPWQAAWQQPWPGPGAAPGGGHGGWGAGPGAGPGPGPGPGGGWGPPPGAAAADPFGAAFGQMADQQGLGFLRGAFNMDDGEFWKGALVGAAVVLLLKDEKLRDSLLGGAARAADALRSGLAGFGAGEQEAAGEAAQDEENDP